MSFSASNGRASVVPYRRRPAWTASNLVYLYSTLESDAHHACPYRAFVTDFYSNVTTHPKKNQRIELAEQVARISGYADYTEANVSHYFASLRKADRDKAQKVSKAMAERTGTITSAAVRESSIRTARSSRADVRPSRSIS